MLLVCTHVSLSNLHQLWPAHGDEYMLLTRLSCLVWLAHVPSELELFSVTGVWHGRVVCIGVKGARADASSWSCQCISHCQRLCSWSGRKLHGHVHATRW